VRMHTQPVKPARVIDAIKGQERMHVLYMAQNMTTYEYNVLSLILAGEDVTDYKSSLGNEQVRRLKKFAEHAKDDPDLEIRQPTRSVRHAHVEYPDLDQTRQVLRMRGEGASLTKIRDETGLTLHQIRNTLGEDH